MSTHSADPGATPVALAAVLAATAGYVDALAYVNGGSFVANMTGNTVLLGIGMVHGDWHAAGRSGGSIAAFMLGVMLARWLLRAEARHQRPLAVAIVLLVLAAIVPGPLRLLALAAAMGLQDAAVTHFGGTSINTAFVTGDLVQLGTAVATWRTQALAPLHAAHLAIVWVCYLSGASLGGLASGLHAMLWNSVDMRFIAVAGLLGGVLLTRSLNRGREP